MKRVEARRTVLLATMTCAALVLLSCAVAFAAVRTGTDENDTLTGTNDNDKITGKGGDDTTSGKKGNDTYVYADGWGHDAVIDSAGKDTLDFSQVSGRVNASLCTDNLATEPRSQGYASDGTTNNEVVYASGINDKVTQTSDIENVRGGPGPNQFIGCGLNNKYSGGGGNDMFVDGGGLAGPGFGLAPSNEVYSDLGKQGQIAFIEDDGGTDVVNLKPYTTSQIKLQVYNDYTLGIQTSPTTGIVIFDANNTFVRSAGYESDGRIEKVIFRNKTLSSTQLMNQAIAASAG